MAKKYHLDFKVGTLVHSRSLVGESLTFARYLSFVCFLSNKFGFAGLADPSYFSLPRAISPSRTYSFRPWLDGEVQCTM